MIDHGTILDDDPVLTALQMDRHLFNWGHHDTYVDSLVSLDNGKHCLDLLRVVSFEITFFLPIFGLSERKDVLTVVFAASDWWVG